MQSLESELIDSIREVSRAPFIHIHVVPNRRGKVTKVKGLDLEELSEIVRPLKKKFCCGGALIDDELSGKKILQLSGDQRYNLAEYLCKIRGYLEKDIVVHGD